MTGQPTLYHIAQVYGKIIKVRDDALDRYNADPQWHGEPEHIRDIGVKTLIPLIGRECPVLGAVWHDKRLFYQVPINPPVIIPDAMGQPVYYNNSIVPADYVTVVKSGFMEAR